MPGRSSGRRKAAAKDASIKALLTQTYRNSQPQVVSSEKATVMAYIGADTSRDAANITRVMYSVYDKSSGAWSEPIQLDSNATADSMPYLYSDGKDIYIIYLDSAKIFSGNVTLKEYFSSQNLAAAKFDSASGRFASVQKIASSGEKCISAEPRITVNNGVLTAAWQLNGSDPFGQNNENSLVYSTLTVLRGANRPRLPPVSTLLSISRFRAIMFITSATRITTSIPLTTESLSKRPLARMLRQLTAAFCPP